METTLVPEVLQMVGEVIPADVSVAISYERRYIYYQPSPVIDLKIKPGDQVREGSATDKALAVREKIAEYVEGDVFGVPYYGISKPLVRDGQVVGCITAIYPKDMMPFTALMPEPKVLIGKGENGWVPLRLADITFIRSQDGKTWLHTAADSYVNRYSLTELEQLLSPASFLRCHRSYMVNVEAIGFIHPHFHSTFLLEMKDKHRTRVPVSQSYASSFRQILGF
ncbi:LytTR family transcriptional regulator [Brevibacillus ruminantium]|uniref:LytTR family transcriptional regulator n=1 Tax=Brevibacillus ruminantium TaxID=2950604 RepID=A0ABY4WGF6_9BACL|nr:LytTR family DNA-binding domain-containing protein [Brevibacillus ruminantium]USG66207.1 LytTR family transcriptional regulator [Brevibacillus ruminantium]